MNRCYFYPLRSLIPSSLRKTQDGISFNLLGKHSESEDPNRSKVTAGTSGPRPGAWSGGQRDNFHSTVELHLGKSFETHIHGTKEALKSQGFSAKNGTASVRTAPRVEN